MYVRRVQRIDDIRERYKTLIYVPIRPSIRNKFNTSVDDSGGCINKQATMIELQQAKRIEDRSCLSVEIDPQ